MRTILALASLTCLAAATGLAQQAPRGKASPNQGPLDFRCDGMQVFSKPNRVLCQGNVVVRRTDLLVCCEEFEGIADENWSWQQFTCTRDVRALRSDELMWSDKATFVLGTSELVLTGKPRLQRGTSVLEGERVLVNVESDRARIEKPRGRIMPAEVRAPPAPGQASADEPLPATCPVPKPSGKPLPSARP